MGWTDPVGRPMMTKAVPVDSVFNPDHAGSVLAVTLVDTLGAPVAPGGGGSPAAEIIYTKRIDQVSDTVIYVGETIPGTPTSTAFWRIKRITMVGVDIVVEWANDGQLASKWDDRASLLYR